MSDYANDPESKLPSEPLATIEHVQPRTPHIGHTVFFLIFAIGMVMLMQFFIVAVVHLLPAYRALPIRELGVHPKVVIFGELIGYVFMLGLALLIFPGIWHRSFAEGISWNLDAVRRNWFKLILLGIVVAVVSGASEVLFSVPRNLPENKFFASSFDLWIVTILGTLLAPVFEEICFRGFLLPAIAIAWDWFSLPRTSEARERWSATNTLSPAGLAIGAVLTSVAFALLHGKQLNYTIGPLIVLFFVSLVLCAVRIRLRSVAASSLVHASYNGILFVVTFIQTGGYRHLDKMTN